MRQRDVRYSPKTVSRHCVAIAAKKSLAAYSISFDTKLNSRRLKMKVKLNRTARSCIGKFDLVNRLRDQSYVHMGGTHCLATVYATR